MEKRRTRVITGWRQLPRARPGVAKARFSALARGTAKPAPRVAVAEIAANERWETEGGNVEPAK
jgi:hypothetical protein